MNIMLVLVSMCLLCGGIGLLACLMNRVEVRRVIARKRLRLPLASGAVLCLLSGCVALGAQEVVHAQAGKVVAVNLASKRLILKLADGSTMIYQFVSSHEPALSIDKAVRAKTVPVAAYSKVGTNVVVLYFGLDLPTAVAIKELGTDEPKKRTGSVSSFDRHLHSLTLKTDAAEAQTLALTEDTIVDTNNGIVRLADYKPSKGEHVRCFTSGDSETALLVAPQ